MKSQIRKLLIIFILLILQTSVNGACSDVILAAAGPCTGCTPDGTDYCSSCSFSGALFTTENICFAYNSATTAYPSNPLAYFNPRLESKY